MILVGGENLMDMIQIDNNAEWDLQQVITNHQDNHNAKKFIQFCLGL